MAELEISLFLLRRLLGVKSEDKKQTKVSKLIKGELLLINIGSTSTGGRVLSVKADLAKIQLTSPACTEIGEKVALSRRIEKHWRLVGKSVARSFAFEDVNPCSVQDGEVYSVVLSSRSISLDAVDHQDFIHDHAAMYNLKIPYKFHYSHALALIDSRAPDGKVKPE